MGAARKEPTMPDEPAKPRRKRRDNRPPGVDDLRWSNEVTYNRSLRPLWDRNLKYQVMLPPLPKSRKSQEKSP